MSKRNIRHASDRELNALMLAMDLDLTARGIEHRKPPYIRPRRRIDWGGVLLGVLLGVVLVLIIIACAWLSLLAGRGG